MPNVITINGLRFENAEYLKMKSEIFHASKSNVISDRYFELDETCEKKIKIFGIKTEM